MRADDGNAAYLAVGVGLIAFGVISIFSIGYPLISFGIAHLALYRVRHRRSIRLPIMWGLVAFWVTFVLVAPMVCSTTSITGIIEESCRSGAGIRYPKDPSFLPGLIAGFAAAILVAALVLVRLRTRGGAPSGGPGDEVETRSM